MSFIQRLGSKQYPVPLKNRPKMEFGKKKESVITNIEMTNVQNKINLKIIGTNLDLNIKYKWTVTIDSKVISPTTEGKILTLSKNNSKKFLNANYIDVKVIFGGKESKLFILKNVIDNKETTTIDN